MSAKRLQRGHSPQAKLQKLQEEAALLKKEKVNISHILGDMSQSC